MTVEKRHPLLKRLFNTNDLGMVPASGGGTANFLRADGTWAAPSGGSSPTALATAILADSPAAYWKCEDASSGFVDSSGNGFNLTTVTGTVSFRQGPFIPAIPGTSYALIGAMSGGAAINSVSATTQLGLTYPLTNWTVEAIVNPASIQGATRILDLRLSGGGNTPFVLTQASNAFQFWVTASTVVSAPWVAYNKPAHVMVTCSTSAGVTTYKIYVNGVQYGQASPVAGAVSGTMVMTIGGVTGGTTSPFYVGHCAVYNSTLSAARALAHAQAAGLYGM